MKKIILILVIMLIGSVTYAENKDFRFYSFGEFAYYPTLVDPYPNTEGIQFSTTVAIGFEYKFLFVEVQQTVNMVKSDKMMFQPYREKYYLRAGVNIWALTFEYEHLCTHAVSMNGNLGGYDKVSIQFDSRNL